MDERVQELVEATRDLVRYIESESVFDKAADGGCGYLDTYRSEAFDRLLQRAKQAANRLDGRS